LVHSFLIASFGIIIAKGLFLKKKYIWKIPRRHIIYFLGKLFISKSFIKNERTNLVRSFLIASSGIIISKGLFLKKKYIWKIPRRYKISFLVNYLFQNLS
jgi:hypothetical protein